MTKRFESIIESWGSEWREIANCQDADPDIFFPDRGGNTRAAKAICRECFVKSECLEYAIESGEKFGVWGGESEKNRRKIKKERRMQSNKDANAA